MFLEIFEQAAQYSPSIASQFAVQSTPMYYPLQTTVTAGDLA